MNIKESIRLLALSGREIYCKTCKVDAVNEEARTIDCTPLDESAPLLSVNLQADQSSENGCVFLPAVGSYVVVAFLDDNTAVCVLTDEIDKIVLKIGETDAEIIDGAISLDANGTTVKIDSNGVVINGGNLGGLVKISQLSSNLNLLKTYIETLQTLTSTAIAPLAALDGGASLTTFNTAWATVKGSMQLQDMENIKVKQ